LAAHQLASRSRLIQVRRLRPCKTKASAMLRVSCDAQYRRAAQGPPGSLESPAQRAIRLVGLALIKLGHPDTRAAVWTATAWYIAAIAFAFWQALSGDVFLPSLG